MSAFRTVAALAALLASGACVPSDGGDPAPARPPNVLLVVADDFGADAFDTREGDLLHAATPTFDRLRAEGVTFTRTWANPVCSPTRATLLTGRYSFRTGVGTAVKQGRPGLPHEELTIPEALDLAPALGYRHAAFGKWHLTNVELGGAEAPNLTGFSHFSGSLFGANPLKVPHDTNGYFRWSHVEDGEPSLREGYRESHLVDEALEWIGAGDGPWFALLSFSLPHVPLHAPPAALHSVALPDAPPEEAPLPYFRAMVEAMDHELGRLLAGLGPAAEQTVVVFVGDNGTDGVVVRAATPSREAQAKGLPFEGGVHVPLVVAGPGVVEGGRRCDALVNTTDVFATVIDLAGVPRAAVEAAARGPLDAESLVPFLRDPGRTGGRDLLLAEVFGGETDDSYAYRAVRDERHKLIRRTGLGRDREWLFDLARDPGEERDLLAGPPSDAARAARDRLARHLDGLVGGR